MRKTVIAVLLIFAMLFVSCSPSATENKTPAEEQPSEGGDSSGGDETKEPTAEDFFESYYAEYGISVLTSHLEGIKDEDGNIAKEEIGLVTLSDVFEDTGRLNRYCATKVTSFSGTVKSKDEAEDIVIEFEYYPQTRTSKTEEWPDIVTDVNDENYVAPSTGTLAFSYKLNKVKNAGIYEYTYSSKLNFNPYKNGYAPVLDNAETTTFKDISITINPDIEPPVTSASVEGIKLNDTEWAKVSAVLNAGS